MSDEEDNFHMLSDDDFVDDEEPAPEEPVAPTVSMPEPSPIPAKSVPPKPLNPPIPAPPPTKKSQPAAPKPSALATDSDEDDAPPTAAPLNRPKIPPKNVPSTKKKVSLDNWLKRPTPPEAESKHLVIEFFASFLKPLIGALSTQFTHAVLHFSPRTGMTLEDFNSSNTLYINTQFPAEDFPIFHCGASRVDIGLNLAALQNILASVKSDQIIRVEMESANSMSIKLLIFDRPQQEKTKQKTKTTEQLNSEVAASVPVEPKLSRLSFTLSLLTVEARESLPNFTYDGCATCQMDSRELFHTITNFIKCLPEGEDDLCIEVKPGEMDMSIGSETGYSSRAHFSNGEVASETNAIPFHVNCTENNAATVIIYPSYLKSLAPLSAIAPMARLTIDPNVPLLVDLPINNGSIALYIGLRTVE